MRAGSDLVDAAGAHDGVEAVQAVLEVEELPVVDLDLHNHGKLPAVEVGE